MTEQQAEAWRGRVCRDKAPYRRRQAAQQVADRVGAERGQVIRAYRCPFDASHFHTGHPPSMRALQATARAMRTLRHKASA